MAAEFDLNLADSYPAFDHIIIWRHAEAELADFELGEQDNARQLTPKGQKQAKRMARWLKAHMPKHTALVSSPALRAVQTADTLNYKMQLDSALLPNASLAEVLNALAQYQQHKSILVVGHQPWLGQLTAYLFAQAVSNSADIQPISVKKGAVWWLRRHSADSSQPAYYKLYTLQTPSLL